MRKSILLLFVSFLVFSCTDRSKPEQKNLATLGFMWENASVYFLLTDRFYNGDNSNDINFGREPDGAPLRSFMGGDFAGIIEKIEEGYFDSLGIDALWFNPFVEQIHGSVDEGTGKTYGYHGYWAKDWTTIDPNFGDMATLRRLVETAHAHDIRILMDVVINHTGPVTEQDPLWPQGWVRTGPQCSYQDASTTIECTLVENLPDIKTGSDQEVELPKTLLDKWEKEGRLEQELAELDEFFEETGYPRAPRFYIMKWLVDYVKELGIDGYRVDTAKHTQASIWGELYELASVAFEKWKSENPDSKLDDTPFFMVGEVYGYGIGHGLDYPYTDSESVNFFANGFKSLINFSLKYDAEKNLEETFAYYDQQLNGELKGKTVLNYLASHDDHHPFDKDRTKTFESANILMLTPGQAQIYYGDESARPLHYEGAEGDAHLRTFMNWENLNDPETKELLTHWQKLGQFRKAHPAVGAGRHQKMQDNPYVFSRTIKSDSYMDQVVIAMDYSGGEKIDVSEVFADDDLIRDAYTKKTAQVVDGFVMFDQPSRLLLLEKL